MGSFDLSLLQGAVAVAKTVFESRQFGRYGLTAATLQDLQGLPDSGLQDLAALSDPRFAAGVYLVMGVAARHDASVEATRYAIGLTDLVSSLPPGALDLVPPVLRDASFWTRRLHGGAQPSFEGLLTAPALAPCWEEISCIWEGYQKEGMTKILEAIRKIRAYLDSCPATLTPDHFDRLPKFMKGITSTLHNVGFEIGEVLKWISSFAESEDLRLSLRKISSFLSHDNVSMVPWFWGIVGRGRDTPNEQALMELASQMTRTLFAEEFEEALVQLLAFPIGIIPDLYCLHNRRSPPLDDMNPYQIATVALCCATLRVLAVDLLPRTALQEPGLQNPLVFSRGPLGPGVEGFGVFGDERATITTYPNLWLSIVYNAIKNAVFAIGSHYDHEDPRPKGTKDDLGPWEARQQTRVAQAKVRLEIAVTPTWNGTSLGGVHWLSIHDSAGGFPLNLIIEKAQDLIVTETTVLLQGWSTEAGLPRADLTARLRSLSMEQQGKLVTHLQQRLGLRDRRLVEGLYWSLLNPHLVSLLKVQEVMELAAIDRLSGRERGPWWQSSGFGLFGIQALASTGGVGYYSYLMPDGPFSGTRTVVASQSLNGTRHSENAIRSVLESLTL